MSKDKKPLPFRVATYNGNFGTRVRKQMQNYARLMGEHMIKVLAVQENRAPFEMLKRRFRRKKVVAAPERRTPYSSQILVVAQSVRAKARGSRLAFKSTFGQKIDFRSHTWVLVKDAALVKPTVIISIHVPPRYMWRGNPLLAVFRLTLRRTIKRHQKLGRQVIVLGDYNYVLRKHGDVLDLESLGLHKVGGSRIDQICCSRSLVAVDDAVEIKRPDDTPDDHPLLYVDLMHKSLAA